MNFIGIKKLRNKCQNTNYGYSNYPLMFRFFRLISIYFTWLFIQTNLTPNAITVIGIFLGVMSGVAFVVGAPLLAVCLVFFAIILDFSDGEVSRFKQLTSKEGSYLDKIHHVVVHPFFLGGLVVWMERNLECKLVLPFGMISVLNSVILPFVLMYAIDVALLKHLLREINFNNFFTIELVCTKTEIKAKEGKLIHLIKVLISLVQRFCDFPYVVVIFSLITIGFLIDSTVFTRKILVYSIIAYSAVTSLLIIMYLFNILLRKGVVRRLNEVKIFLKDNVT